MKKKRKSLVYVSKIKVIFGYLLLYSSLKREESQFLLLQFLPQLICPHEFEAFLLHVFVACFFAQSQAILFSRFFSSGDVVVVGGNGGGGGVCKM